jgi:DNA-binding CsgD family transcriptional regulator/tetratricopeptide (TPR) repeat protein
MASALRLIRTVSRTGQGGGLAITGEAGIGKSAFVAAVVKEASRLGAVCAQVQTDRVGRIVPGGPLLTALRDGQDPVLSADAFAPVQAAASQPLLLLDAVTAALEKRAAEQPILIAVDDAQWLDDLSAFVLRSLPRRLAGSPVVWVVATRAGDLPLLEALCGGEPKDGAFSRIGLGPLSDDDVIAMAHDLIGKAPGPLTRGMLERVQGSPFLTVMVVAGMLDSRNRDDPRDLPGVLVRAVRRQLESIPDQAIKLIQLAAVFGEPLPFDDAAVLLGGISMRVVTESAAEAETTGILSSERGTVRFRHSLIREAVYADLPERTRQSTHLACARHLREAGYDALTVATHAREAITPGDEEVALLLAEAAGDAIAAMPQTAVELMMTAFTALRPGQRSWLTVGERCVELLSLALRSTDALNVADQLLAYVDDEEAAGRIEIAVSRALWSAGKWTEAERRCRDALKLRGLSPAIQSRLEALHTLTLSRVSSPSIARSAAEHALAAAEMAGDGVAREFALHALAEAARYCGDHRTALSYFRRLRTESGPAYAAQEIATLQHLDRYQHAETLLSQAWQQAGNDSAAVLPSLLYAQIWQDYNLARLDDAETTARTLLTLGQELGSRVYQLDTAAIIAAVALLRGDVEDARHRLALGGSPEPEELAHIPVLTLVRGWLTAEEGDAASAVEQLTPLLTAALDERDPWPWKPGWMRMLTRIGIAAENADFTARAVDLAEQGARRNPDIATFEAIGLGLRGAVDGDLDHLARAAQLAESSPRPLVRAGVYEDYGRALLLDGDVKAGGERLDQAWAVYDEVGADSARAEVQRVMRAAGLKRAGWRTAQTRPSDGWAALTEAELRVARLIGEGHTNKSAAAELIISVNTVGTQLRSVFAKLGVRSRVQLTNKLNARNPS